MVKFSFFLLLRVSFKETRI